MKRPQFSLRMLLLLTALVAAIIGWLIPAIKTRNYERLLQEARDIRNDDRKVTDREWHTEQNKINELEKQADQTISH